MGQVIRKTCPCNVYLLKPHVYVIKLGKTGVYLFFLFLIQNIDCGYSLEPPHIKKILINFLFLQQKKKISALACFRNGYECLSEVLKVAGLIVTL